MENKKKQWLFKISVTIYTTIQKFPSSEFKYNIQ